MLLGHRRLLFLAWLQLLPLVLLYITLAKIDKSVMGAYDLGANDMKRLLKVTIPLSMPGVMSGITMVFMPAMTIFCNPIYWAVVS